MAEINRIKIGDNLYDIVPRIGTGICCEDGVIHLSLGSGLLVNGSQQIALNLGSAFMYDTVSGKINLSIGTAVVSGLTGVDCGITIDESGFTINSVIFIAFLKSLGVKFEDL